MVVWVVLGELHWGRWDVWGGENDAGLWVWHKLLSVRGHVGEGVVRHHPPY